MKIPFSTYLTPELKRDIKIAAAEAEKTMAQWAEEVLGAAVRKHRTRADAKEKR